MRCRRGDGKAVAFAERPVPATAANRAKAADFLEQATSGTTDPVPAIPVAFAGDPDVICFVADGDAPGNRAVLRAFRRAGAAKRTRVNAIAFVGDGFDEEEPSQGFLSLMRQLASENGGQFALIREPDLP